MSTVYDVFPGEAHIPSFREVLDLSTRHLNEFLRSYGIKRAAAISVGLRTNDEASRVLPIDLAGPCWWTEDQYAWFCVPPVLGGTDAYASVINDPDEEDVGRSILMHEIAVAKWGELGDLAHRALGVGRYWGFRRSVGQSATVNIAYGIIAGSLAELTGGVVHSIDCAWGYRRLPARAADFFGWFMRPELADNADDREWAQRCIDAVVGELRGRPPWDDPAPGFFQTAKEAADRGEHEAAIELYLKGLGLDPDNVDAHRALREVAWRRKAAGGGPLGLFHQLWGRWQRAPGRKMLAAERLLAYEPGCREWMVAMAQAAAAGGYVETQVWLSSIMESEAGGDEVGRA